MRHVLLLVLTLLLATPALSSRDRVEFRGEPPGELVLIFADGFASGDTSAWAPPVCLPPGSACTANPQCCSGICAANVCV